MSGPSAALLRGGHHTPTPFVPPSPLLQARFRGSATTAASSIRGPLGDDTFHDYDTSETERDGPQQQGYGYSYPHSDPRSSAAGSVGLAIGGEDEDAYAFMGQSNAGPTPTFRIEAEEEPPPDERKRLVLERNRSRAQYHLPQPQSQSNPEPQPPVSGMQWETHHQEPSFSDRASPQPPQQHHYLQPDQTLPHTHREFERANTPESMYSDYSYHHLPDPPSANRPSIDERPPTVEVLRPTPKVQFAHNDPHTEKPRATTPGLVITAADGSTVVPQREVVTDWLQLGITHHEAGRLEESARCFEKSATLNGGTVVGMLMYGLSLRHGWGCPKDEKKGFKFLKRAAEHSVVDLEAEGKKEGKEVLKTELVLAVYEVGQCFFQGWGVEKDKKMGVSYFETAARMGDADAQQDLAFCLANGKGCKKDRKKAATWYRKAVAQGASSVGLAWIYKAKYME